MAAEETTQDGSKTLVSFVVGLLIGGMLVWAFSGPTPEAVEQLENSNDSVMDSENSEDVSAEEVGDLNEVNSSRNTTTLPTGDGSIGVSNQAAGKVVSLNQATYPINEGWIGVRDYNNGQLGFIKGVIRFSAAAGRVPQTIPLQAPTQAGKEYAVVIFTDNGDNAFNPAGDVQIDQIFATFTAQ